MVEIIADNVHNWLNDFIGFIEKGYLSMSSSIEYRHFWIQLLRIGDDQTSELENESEIVVKDSLLKNYRPMLRFESKIICSDWICNRIIEDFEKTKFEEYVTADLQTYFVNYNANPTDESALVFSVVTETNALSIQSLVEDESPPYVLYAIASISGTLVMIGLSAFLFNKIPDKCAKFPGFNVVDDGKWAAVIIFALQFWYALHCLHLSSMCADC